MPVWRLQLASGKVCGLKTLALCPGHLHYSPIRGLVAYFRLQGELVNSAFARDIEGHGLRDEACQRDWEEHQVHLT